MNASTPRPWHIELASSNVEAPLYLAVAGTRIRWVQERSEATAFGSSDEACDLVWAERLKDIVRVRC